MQECENRKYETDIKTGNGREEKRVWLTVDLLNVEKGKSEEIFNLAETLKEDIKKILTR